MKKYYLLFLLIFTCVGLSIVYALIVLDRNDGLKLVINTLPEDANITINDKPGKRGSNPFHQVDTQLGFLKMDSRQTQKS